MRHAGLIALSALCLAAAAFAHGRAVQPLKAAQVPQLLAPPAHGERVVMLWALQCLYCEPNMRELARLQRAHPRRVELVLVSTDSIAERRAITARLAQMHMQGYPARAYVEATPTRMNFLIDPTWGGEMPRTLVIRADGSRLAISGLLTPTQLKRIAPR